MSTWKCPSAVRPCALPNTARLFPALMLLAALSAVAQPIGGGILNGGLDGDYFPNPDLAGPPSFSRRDVRVDFDWGANGKPGGSTTSNYAAVGADNFSVRWTGQFSPRFSETYAFKLIADDGARLLVKRAGDAAFTTLVDAWNAPGTNTAAMPLQEREVYDLRLEYRELAGPARVRLSWSCPSAPEAVMESATIAAINVDTYGSELWANAMDGGRDEWRDSAFSDNRALWPARDPNGWPLGDAETIVWEGRSGAAMAGDYLLQFRGRAQIRTGFNAGRFRTGTNSHGTTLPFGAGWDPASNLTTATMSITSADILYLEFTNTRREPADTNATGIAEVRLMRPAAVGGSNSYPATALFGEPLKRAFARYNTVRWILNFETERAWSQRVLPAYSTHHDTGSQRYWEQMILLANEAGKDLYACLPHGADDDYVTRVAKMLRYGSDGVNPYDGPEANPAYPPLNPNLRALIERGNEIWNWSFAQAGQSAADGQSHVRNNTPSGQILNYDGANPTGDNFNRWHALRTVQMSELFRAVWGDAAMGDRIRFLLEYQYDNAQSTASEAFDFLDRYFNNADGRTNVAVPRPVNDFIWGGGGALYYGSGNANGAQTNTVFANASFEDPVLADGDTLPAPPGAAWNFTGTAGIYRRAARLPLTTNDVLGAAANTLTNSRSLGFQFTVGAAPMAVYELGRWVTSGNSRTHTVRLIRASDKSTLASLDLNLSGKPSGRYYFATLSLPVVLATNTTYYLVSSESAGGDTFCDTTTTATPLAGVTVEGAVSASGTSSSDPTTWTFSLAGGPNTAFGPVNCRVATAPVGPLDYPPDPPDGAQALYLMGTGEVSQVVSFMQTGVFALRFQAAAKVNKETGVKMYFDGQNITASGASHEGPGSSHWVPGSGWSRDYRVFENNGSYVFNVTNPGPHTILIQCTGQPRYGGSVDTNRAIYFDKMEFVTADAIFAGGIPDAGQANGQVTSGPYTAQLNSQARYAEAYGLRVTAYEGGWSLGGDFGSVALQNWAKFRDPRSRQAQRDSAEIFARSGGTLYTFGTYSTWPNADTARAETYPLTQGVDDFIATLPPEPLNGIFAPAVLTPGNSKWSRRANTSTGALNETGGWFGWNVLIPATAGYEVAVETGGSGTARLVIDGAPFGPGFPAGAPFTNTLTLTRGLHNLRVPSAGGSFPVTRVVVSQPGASAAPVLGPTRDGDSSIALTWTPPANGPAPTNYLIRYGTAAGVYTSAVDAGAAMNLTVSNLANNTSYFFVVVAQGAGGNSLPSNERAATPMAPDLEGNLAQWDFAGYTGKEPNAPPTAATSRLTASALTRGPGLKVTGYGTDIAGNSFSSEVNNGASTNLQHALGKGHYYEFTLRATPGHRLALASLMFKPYWQNATGGAGVAYSTDGVNFSIVPATGIVSSSGSTWTADLRGETALQNTRATITIRLLMWGVQTYQFSGLGRASGNDVEVRGSFNLWNAAYEPQFSPPAALYTNFIMVALTSETADAAIRYTTDGSEPSATAGALYTRPIFIAANATLKAIACRNGMLDSAVVSASYTITNPPVLAAATLISTNAVWHYSDDGQDLGAAWRALDYDDSSWKQGMPKFGYGDDGELTRLNYGPPSGGSNYPTYYFRHRFVLTNAAAFTNLQVRIIRDDGAVIYVNDTEVFRSNMTNGPVSYRTYATNVVGGAEENSWFTNAADARVLREGTNILAAEVHQANSTSGDLGFNLELTGAQILPPLPPPPLWAATWGVAPGTVAFSLATQPGRSYTVFTSSNLVDWVVLTNLFAEGDLFQFTDLPGSSSPVRFYRARTP